MPSISIVDVCFGYVIYYFRFYITLGTFYKKKKKTDGLKLIMTFTYISPKERQKSLLLLKKTPFQPHKKNLEQNDDSEQKS